ncbi:uncharacterized protein LOC143286491 [Babylonia areolata]|uniref:uncharacterized protein LOC143286491 n=1 Tax=Babylonia areolata TaxID=304850 RepID=UPI003FD37651
MSAPTPSAWERFGTFCNALGKALSWTLNSLDNGSMWAIENLLLPVSMIHFHWVVIPVFWYLLYPVGYGVLCCVGLIWSWNINCVLRLTGTYEHVMGTAPKTTGNGVTASKTRDVRDNPGAAAGPRRSQAIDQSLAG